MQVKHEGLESAHDLPQDDNYDVILSGEKGTYDTGFAVVFVGGPHSHNSSSKAEDAVDWNVRVPTHGDGVRGNEEYVKVCNRAGVVWLNRNVEVPL